MDTLLHICLGVLGLTVLLGLVRLAKGPTVVDRMLAFDLIAVSGVGVIAIVSVLRETAAYFELILVYSLLGFLGTVALTRFLQRNLERRTRERPAREGGARG